MPKFKILPNLSQVSIILWALLNGIMDNGINQLMWSKFIQFYKFQITFPYLIWVEANLFIIISRLFGSVCFCPKVIPLSRFKSSPKREFLKLAYEYPLLVITQPTNLLIKNLDGSPVKSYLPNWSSCCPMLSEFLSFFSYLSNLSNYSYLSCLSY